LFRQIAVGCISGLKLGLWMDLRSEIIKNRGGQVARTFQGNINSCLVVLLFVDLYPGAEVERHSVFVLVPVPHCTIFSKVLFNNGICKWTIELY